MHKESSDCTDALFFVISAGCANLQSDNQTSTLSCSLSHEIVYDDQVGRIEAEYTYSELSPTAKTYFESALAANDSSYDVNSSSTATPEEFSYTDTYTYYKIYYNNETYILSTLTSEGCSFE